VAEKCSIPLPASASADIQLYVKVPVEDLLLETDSEIDPDLAQIDQHFNQILARFLRRQAAKELSSSRYMPYTTMHEEAGTIWSPDADVRRDHSWSGHTCAPLAGAGSGGKGGQAIEKGAVTVEDRPLA
jgi:hypothetical protein